MKILSIDDIANILKFSSWIIQDAITKNKINDKSFFNTFTEEDFLERIKKYKIRHTGYNKFFIVKINIEKVLQNVKPERFYTPNNISYDLEISLETLYVWKMRKLNISYYQFFGGGSSIRYRGEDVLEFIKAYKKREAADEITSL